MDKAKYIVSSKDSSTHWAANGLSAYLCHSGPWAYEVPKPTTLGVQSQWKTSEVQQFTLSGSLLVDIY